MGFESQIKEYQPQDDRAAADHTLALNLVRDYGDRLLNRDLMPVHITSSGFIVNQKASRVLLVHHNLRDCWSWPGGHADGNPHLSEVAQREICEETGIGECRLLTPDMASIDILSVGAHQKGGCWIPAHLHLSVAYLFCCGETAALSAKPEETSRVCWFDVSFLTSGAFYETDRYLYGKLLARAGKLLCP